MPLLTIAIDDKSPLISYDQTWAPGTSQDDLYTVDYYMGTHQKNNATDGTATFSFNGTAFWIYGANRPNHGHYRVQVDGENYPSISGFGDNLFQQSLFNSNVGQAMHNVSLINSGGAYGFFVDIDMIVWQSQVGNPDDQLVPELVQDVDPRFQYHTEWQTTSPSTNLNLNLFNNGTGHVTNNDASVSFTFTLTVSLGDAVTLFGTSGPSNGLYSVQLDGSESVTYNASNGDGQPTNYGVIIYHADNLGPGAHQILLTNLPSTASGQYLAIDYAQLWTLASASNSTTVVTCAPSSELNPGVIAGLAVEGVVAILAAIAAAIFYRRWKAALSASRTQMRLPSMAATTTEIAPSDGRNNAGTYRDGMSFQPLTTAGQSYQLDNNSAMQGADFSGQVQNEAQAVERDLLPGGINCSQLMSLNFADPVGVLRHSVLEDTISLPPGYDTVVRNSYI